MGDKTNPHSLMLTSKWKHVDLVWSNSYIMWSRKPNEFFPVSAHRPRSPRQNSVGGASSLPAAQTGTAPVETVAAATSASSPTAASPAPPVVASASGDGMVKV